MDSATSPEIDRRTPRITVEEEISQMLAANRPGRALELAQRAVLQHPADPKLHYHIGLARFLLGDEDSACASLEKVLAIDSHSFDAHLLLGAMLQQRKRPVEALAHYQEAARIRPEDPAVHGYAGNMQFLIGRHAEAIACYERALAIEPANATIHSNLLLAMNSIPGIDRGALFEAHLLFGKRQEQRWSDLAPTEPDDPDPERPLRVGYVSADFRNHSVAYFLEPVWSHIDRARYATYVYDNFSGDPDDTSLRLRRHADLWCRVADMSDTALAQRVREDRIDILVDLSGHTGGNRLPLFARKPAPLQVTWFAYMNTTGLASMDYRITDKWLAPPGDEQYYTETLFRIPCCACFAPAPETPAVDALPALSNGFVTFASFNNWTKVSTPVISAWARILTSIPGSRLLVVVHGGDDPKVRKGIHEDFAARGIEAGRLDIRAIRPIAEFLRMFNNVDIALDSFPYTGGTTSLHTLWMGVPIVTLQSAGETGRCSASYLHSMGLADIVAHSVDEYCDIAIRLAGEPARLQRIRATLRETMMQSPIMQAAETTQAVQSAFRQMWRARVTGGRISVKIRQAVD